MEFMVARSAQWPFENPNLERRGSPPEVRILLSISLKVPSFQSLSLMAVTDNDFNLVYRKKQFNTAVQGLKFSEDGKVMFSSAAQKEAAVSQVRMGDDDILSVEFGGYSKEENKSLRDSDLGGDIRIMGLDARAHKLDDRDGYLVCLVYSHSVIKVPVLPAIAHDSCIGSTAGDETAVSRRLGDIPVVVCFVVILSRVMNLS